MATASFSLTSCPCCNNTTPTNCFSHFMPRWSTVCCVAVRFQRSCPGTSAQSPYAVRNILLNGAGDHQGNVCVLRTSLCKAGTVTAAVAEASRSVQSFCVLIRMWHANCASVPPVLIWPRSYECEACCLLTPWSSGKSYVRVHTLRGRLPVSHLAACRHKAARASCYTAHDDSGLSRF